MFLLKLFMHHHGGLRVCPAVYVDVVGFICRGWLQSLQQYAGMVPQIRTFALSANCFPIHYLLTFFSQEQQEMFIFSETSIPPLCPTHSPTQRLPGVLFLLGKKVQHLHLVPKLKMSRALPLCPQYAFMAWTEITLSCYGEKLRLQTTDKDNFHSRTVHLDIIKVFYIPTDTQENSFKRRIKIYIKTAAILPN
jgi:hypothetical protein